METGDIRLLVADDDPDAFFLLTRALRDARRPVSLEHCATGTALVEKLRSTDAAQLPAAIIVDLEMPGMTGFEVLDWIRAQPSLAKLPVIITSSRTDTSTQNAAERKGCSAFVTKSISWKDFKRGIQSVEHLWAAA